MMYLLLLLLISIIIFATLELMLLARKSSGSKKMQDVSSKIQKGAFAFLAEEYKILIIFILVIAIALGIFNPGLMVAFVLGSFLSLDAGNIGMRIATKNNVKVSAAARSNMDQALRIAFFSGLCASLFAVVFGIVGILILYFLFGVKVLYGFAFGASFVALFMRVGGGIFTKSADIAADLTGKIEVKIPEDDPRNPAVVADLVGDNVGDIAGMGSDLFESFCSSIIAAMAIAAIIFENVYAPLVLAAIGSAAAIFASFFVKGNKIHEALLSAFLVATLVVAIVSFFIFQKNVFYCIALGLIAGISIGINTNYFTAFNLKPTKTIASSSRRGAALGIICGLANGMISALLPVLVIVIALIFSFKLAGLYGIAMSAVGMLSIVAVVIAVDIYGSIADNAAGISEFCKLREARKRTELLDEAGNTMAAIGKGFAICSAALTALALVATYLLIAKIDFVNLIKHENVAMLFVGVALPFLFSSLTLKAVVSGAGKLVENIRNQFKNKNILQGKEEPNYIECIKITTSNALSALILPSVISIIVPFVVGFLFGKEVLASLLLGSVGSSFLLAVFMANTGASLDNAKKYVELQKNKSKELHEAVVTGDTVGDPLKDTAGPSLNILIKLMATVALIFAILF
ncbi:MAG: sodium-translocating pyrophosphatase [Candidatus Pacearchaeota archaeon]